MIKQLILEYNFKNVLKASMNNERYAYVVYDTLEGIKKGKSPQQSYIDALKYEQYTGNRDSEIEGRKNIAKILKYKFNIIIDPNKF